MSGGVQVAGEPGGLVHLVDGLVVAVETPGAPGVEVQLLRSGRLTDDDWNAVIGGIGGDATRLGPELVARGPVSVAELERLIVAAAYDGAFAVAAGQVLDCRPVTTDPYWLPATPGIPVDLLWREIARRRRVLAGRREPVAHDRDRIVPAAWLDRGAVRLAPEQWELLGHADGRRTPRDLAFALGRGVYAVTLEIARLLDAGLVEVASRRAVPMLEPLAPVDPPPAQVPPPPPGYDEPASPAGGNGTDPGVPVPRLPRRWPGSHPAPGNGHRSPGGGRWPGRLPRGRASWPSTE
jgi:hypothetical protein